MEEDTRRTNAGAERRAPGRRMGWRAQIILAGGWVAVVGVSIGLLRWHICRTVDCDEARDTVAAWLRDNDPYGAVRGYPRDGTIVVDSLKVKEVLKQGGEGGPMRVLADLTYHIREQDGADRPFRGTLTLVRDRRRWCVERFQTVDANEIRFRREAPAALSPQ